MYLSDSNDPYSNLWFILCYVFPWKKQLSHMCSPSYHFMLIPFLGLRNDNNFGRTGCKESQFYSLIFGQAVASFE